MEEKTFYFSWIVIIVSACVAMVLYTAKVAPRVAGMEIPYFESLKAHLVPLTLGILCGISVSKINPRNDLVGVGFNCFVSGILTNTILQLLATPALMSLVFSLGGTVTPIPFATALALSFIGSLAGVLVYLGVKSWGLLGVTDVFEEAFKEFLAFKVFPVAVLLMLVLLIIVVLVLVFTGLLPLTLLLVSILAVVYVGKKFGLKDWVILTIAGLMLLLYLAQNAGLLIIVPTP